MRTPAHFWWDENIFGGMRTFQQKCDGPPQSSSPFGAEANGFLAGNRPGQAEAAGCVRSRVCTTAARGRVWCGG